MWRVVAANDEKGRRFGEVLCTRRLLCFVDCFLLWCVTERFRTCAVGQMMAYRSNRSSTQFSFDFGNRRIQLLRSLFDRYNLINPTIRPHDPFTTLYINKNLLNTAADEYRAPPHSFLFFDESSYYTPHSIATPSYHQPYASTIPLLHSTTTTRETH